MQESIRNESGGHLSRMQSFERSLRRLRDQVAQVAKNARERRESSTARFFAYAFGVQREKGVADLFSLLKAGRNLAAPGEIEKLKDRFTRQIRDRYRQYEGLGGFAASLGLGSIVNGFAQQARADAEREVKGRILNELRPRLESRLTELGDTTIRLEDLDTFLPEGGGATESAEPLIFGNTPMCAALEAAQSRFGREMSQGHIATEKVLFILSDGAPTDGDPRQLANALRTSGVSIVSCLLTAGDVEDPRRLVNKPRAGWPSEARLMFELASPIVNDSDLANFLRKKSWIIESGAKCFVQINHSSVLEEFIQVILKRSSSVASHE